MFDNVWTQTVDPVQYNISSQIVYYFVTGRRFKLISARLPSLFGMLTADLHSDKALTYRKTS